MLFSFERVTDSTKTLDCYRRSQAMPGNPAFRAPASFPDDNFDIAGGFFTFIVINDVFGLATCMYCGIDQLGLGIRLAEMFHSKLLIAVSKRASFAAKRGPVGVERRSVPKFEVIALAWLFSSLQGCRRCN